MEETLLEFLQFPLSNTNGIFNKFKWLVLTENRSVVFRENRFNPKERFLYIEGSRENKVVLIAHADTVWDEAYCNNDVEQEIVRDSIFFKGTNSQVGIGADDRAGCAILWLLRNSGHSLLITDGEEHGRQGARWLMTEHTDIAERINSHQFMVEFDRKNATEYKCYEVGSPEFRIFISANTGYSEPDRRATTDISDLCDSICGVNFSIGYYDEHSGDETINILEWMNTYNIVKKLIEQPNLPQFTKLAIH